MDGKPPRWEPLGIAGFHFCRRLQLHSFRTFLSLNTAQIAQDLIPVAIAITVFEILRGSLPAVVFEKQQQ